MLDTLLNNLQDQTQIFNKMLECTLFQQTCISEANSSSLDEANAVLQEQLVALQTLEAQRNEVAQALCVNLALEPDATISQICDTLNNSYSIRLKNASKELLEVANAVKEANDLNAELLQIHFDFVNYMVEAIKIAPSQSSAIYGASGKEEDYEKKQTICFNAQA